MKNYFKRLKEHPGLPIATIMTVLNTLAGVGNQNFDTPVHGAVFGLAVTFVSLWLPVLISNYKK